MPRKYLVQSDVSRSMATRVRQSFQNWWQGFRREGESLEEWLEQGKCDFPSTP